MEALTDPNNSYIVVKMIYHIGDFEQVLLFALLRLGDRAYGVSIRREIEARTGRQVAAGAVYTALQRLEARGLVTSWIGDATPQRGGRRKRHYRLEPRGARVLHEAYRHLRQMAHGVEPRLARLAAEPGSDQE